MKSNSRISYDALQVEGLKNILVQVSSTCNNLGIHFFIVGAIARNVWYATHDETSGGTKDIDFAVYIPNINEYNKLKKRLQLDYNYNDSGENAYCMLTPDGKQIDLLPFGEIEEERQVMIEGKGLVKINLDGFKEVYHSGLQQVKLGSEIYTVCSVPSIVILKLIAFNDRPEHRIKDIKDINSIVRYYPSLEQNYIWSNHFDLYEDERSHDEVAMIVLGREMKKIVQVNDQLHKRLMLILNKAITSESAMLVHMIEDSEKENLEQKKKILLDILKGLT